MSRRRAAAPALAFAVLALAVAAWAAGGPAGAQPLSVSFSTLTVEDGLADNSVAAITQDAEGFLWLGTQRGLQRFDGYALRTFAHDPDDPGSLADSYVTALLTGRDDALWVGTFGGGLHRLDPVSEHLTRLLPGEGITALAEGPDGALWVGTRGGGLAKLAEGGGEVERFRTGSTDPETPASRGLGSDHVLALLAEDDGTLWVGTFGGGLVRLAPGESRFVRVLPGVDMVQALHRDSDGALWAGAMREGLHRLSPGAAGFESFRHQSEDPSSLGHDHVQGVLEDAEGHLWIATYGGGLSLLAEPNLGTFGTYRASALDALSLPDDFLLTLYQDRSGTVWVGTDGGGVVHFNRKRDRFSQRRADPLDPGSLSHSTVWAFAPGEDARGREVLWVGTSAGLDRFDLSTGRFAHIPSSGGGQEVVWALEPAAAGVLWAGTMADGLLRLERGRVTGRFGHRADDPESLPSDRVRVLAPDGSGGLWVGTQGGGLCRFEPAAGTCRRFRPEAGAGPGHDLVTAVLVDGDAVWVGSLGGGLDLLDPQAGTFRHFHHDPRQRDSLSSDRVRTLLRGADGTLWVGSEAGLDRLVEEPVEELAEESETGGAGASGEHLRFRRYAEADGLPAGAVFCALEDGEGRLWLATAQGISRLDPATGAARGFDVGHDLVGNRFDTAACRLGGGGELLFGGLYGFHRFRPEEVRDNPYVPPVVLTGFSIFDVEVPFRRAMAAGERIELSHRDNDLSFRFAALDSTNPVRNRYAYQLEGFDVGWVECGARREARYPSLPPGEYLFRVKASNNDGVWNEGGVTLLLRISPPFWRTWWAYAGYGLAALLGLLLLLKLQKRGVERRAEDRRKTAELERARALQLSMLPVSPPSLPQLEIAVSMRTATEVGGDYYDFFPQPDGSLYVAIGDATGHGIPAGMMVSMTKVALRSLDVRPPHEQLDRVQEILRDTHPGGVRMALALARLGDGAVELSCAGMPPALLFRPSAGRPAAGRVEEVLLGALPLGGTLPARYARHRAPFGPGDVLVLLSDGLAERRNPAGECLGYGPVEEVLETAGRCSATAILEALLGRGEAWARGRLQEDDVTVVVIRHR